MNVQVSSWNINANKKNFIFKSAECSPIVDTHTHTHTHTYICNLKLTFPEYWRECFFTIIILFKHFGEPKIANWVHACYDSINADVFLLCLPRRILHYTNLPFFGLMCSNWSTSMWICFVFCERKKTRIKWFPVDPITSSRTAEISSSGINYGLIWILSVAEQWDILIENTRERGELCHSDGTEEH